MLTTLDVLRSARKLLSDPKRWGKHAFVQINPETQEPCYCALGAMAAACGIENPDDAPPETLITTGYQSVVRAFSDANHLLYGVWVWNDDPVTTYEEVMSAFSKACEAEFAKTEQEVASC